MIIPDAFHQFQLEFVTVNILIEVKDVYLDGLVFELPERGAVANIKHAAIALLLMVYPNGVYTSRRDELMLLPDIEVGSGETDPGADLVTVRYRTAEGVMMA